MPSRIRTLKNEGKRKGLSPVGWVALMRLTIARAEATGDKRLEGLRWALQEGKSEMFLRKLGVISEADIPREFPSPPES